MQLVAEREVSSFGVRIFSFRDQIVRTSTDEQGNLWWVAKDVCEILGIGNVGDVLSALDEDEKGSIDIVDGTPGSPKRGIVNEPGLYSLILRSRKPEAREFKRWVTHHVLPSIRKSGYYSVAHIGRAQLAQMVLEAEADLDRARSQVALLAPKAESFDRFMDGSNVQTMAKVAKSLGTGRNKLFIFLRSRGILMRNNLPYQSYIDRGYFTVIQKSIPMGGDPVNYAQPMVTPKGLHYIRKLLDHAKAEVQA